VTLEERQLLARHCAGDPAAFGELLARYRAPVYGYLVRRGVEREVRDDLFQEIFLRIHRAAASYCDDAPLHPWVFTIVANTVRSHYRKLRVRRLVFAEASPVPHEPASTEPDGREVTLARETAARLEAGLARLPETQREVVLLCCVENLSPSEVSQILGIPAGTVRTRLARGRAALASSIATRRSESEACK
jgi:RNA polymerase sigma-70 factor (ECF subfamily)